MAVLTYKGGKYRNLAGNKIFDGSRWQNMTSDSKIFLDGAWHNFSWGKAKVPSVPELPDWDSWEHLATEEPTSGTVRYMTPTGNGKHDGSSWSNAFSASQIHVAVLSSADGDRLYLAEGDYGTPDHPLTATGTIIMCGGFIEGDYAWSSRDALKHPTYFKGDSSFEFAGAGTWNIDGLTLEEFKDTNIKASLTNVTALNAGWTNGDVFTNCRFSGDGNCNVHGDKADTCYFSGNERGAVVLYVREMHNSIVRKCAPGNSGILGSIRIIGYSLENSVISEISCNGGSGIAISLHGCKLYNCTSKGLLGNTINCHLHQCTEGNSGTHSGDSIRYSTVGTVEGSIVVDSTVFLSCSNSTLLNCNVRYSLDANAYTCLFANCDGSLYEAVGCTVVNSNMSMYRATSSILWNSNGTMDGATNAQSAYDSGNKLTLGYDNSIARFVNTGYAPAIGIQDIGECPDPTLDPDGFAEYVASFGDWHPQADSFLVGKGVYNSRYPTDLSGVERPDPPTIGAYEPRQENA